MMYRLLSLIPWLAGTLGASLQAQITYPISQYATPGDSFLYSQAPVSANLNWALAGSNVTWDYSALGTREQASEVWLNPDRAGYRTAWIARCVAAGNPLTCFSRWDQLTNLAIRDFTSVEGLLSLLPVSVSDWTRHLNKRGNALTETLIGLRIAGAPILANVSQADTLLRFPLQYRQQDSSQGAWRIALGVAEWSRSQQRYNEVEGWGKLITPFDTFPDVLKVKTLIERQDSLHLGSDSTIGLPRQLIRYQWFAPGYGQPVLRATGDLVGGTAVISRIEFLDGRRCITPNSSFVASSSSLFIDPGTGTAEVRFLDTSQGVDSVHWDFADGNTSSQASPTHAFQAQGSYRVALIGCNTICDPVQCDTFVFPIVVTDSTRPSAAFTTVRQPICVGDSISFVNASIFADSYRWDFGDGHGSTRRTPRHAYTSAGTYPVQLIAIKGSAEDTASTQVQVNDVPAIALRSDTTIEAGDSVRLSASVSGGGFAFTWTPAQDSLNPWVSPDSSRTYQLIARNDCGQDTSSVTITVDQTSSLRVAADPIQVSPNPSAGRFHLELPQALPRARWSLLDGAGRRLQGGALRSTHWDLDLSDRPAGVYWLVVGGGGIRYRQALLKE